MYAITATSFRAIASVDQLLPGEVMVAEVPLALSQVIESIKARERRNSLLRACDWTQVPDAPLPAEARSAWGIYRQALRDLPQQPGFPDVPWPDPPGLPEGAAGGVEPITP